MVYFQATKRSIEILCKRVNGPVQSGHCYSTWACRRSSNSLAEFRESKSSYTTHYANGHPDFGIFVRRYGVDSVEVSVLEQMNLIKQLRERTSAPIKDVKSSLVERNWDIEAAQKDLRKKGAVLASKYSSRTAAAGLLALAQNENKAAVIELNCETDFVARNEIFQYLASSLAKLALLVDDSQQLSGVFPIRPELLEDLKINFEHPKLSGERTVQTAITKVAAMMGENVKLRRGFAMYNSSHGIMSTYLHTSPQPGLERIAGILSLEVKDQNASLDALQRVGSESAMHVVAAKPLFLMKELVSSTAIENEREILKSQAETSRKPQMAI